MSNALPNNTLHPSAGGRLGADFVRTLARPWVSVGVSRISCGGRLLSFRV